MMLLNTETKRDGDVNVASYRLTTSNGSWSLDTTTSGNSGL